MIKKIVCIICIFFMIFLIISCENKENNELNMEYTKEQESFLEELKIIENLEIIANEYISNNNNLEKDTTLLVLSYIRNIRYSTTTWNLVAGVPDAEFSSYIENNYKDLNNEIYSIEYIFDTFTNEKIDFIHLCATLNVSIYGNNKSSQDLAGWGGDLVQFASAIKNKIECVEDFGTDKGSFNRMDLIADIDSINLYNIYKNTNSKSIYNTMIEYYKALKNDKRQNIFRKNLNLENISKIEQVEYLFNRIKNNAYLNILNSNYGLSFEDELDQEIFNNIIYVFIEYINN